MNEILGVIFQIKAPKQYFVLYYAVQVGWRLTFEFDDAWNKSFMPCTKQHFPDEVFVIMLNKITLSFDSVDKISRPDHFSNIATEDYFLLCLLVCTKFPTFLFCL